MRREGGGEKELQATIQPHPWGYDLPQFLFQVPASEQPLPKLVFCSHLSSIASLVQQNQDFTKRSSGKSSPHMNSAFGNSGSGPSRDFQGQARACPYRAAGHWLGSRAGSGAPALLAGSCHCLLRFLDPPRGQLPEPVNQALQNATHLDRMEKSLRGPYCGAGMRGQSGLSLLPVPVPSQVSKKTFIRAELGVPTETAPREPSGLEQTKMIGTYLECGKGVGWGSAAAAW